MPLFALMLALAVTVSGGTALASENALPGDALYTVKTSVTEEIRGAFAFGSEAKAEWEAKRLERRAEELDRLEAAGRIDAETRATIETKMEERAEKAAKRAEMILEKHPEAAERIRVKLDQSLKTDTDGPKNFGHEVRLQVRGKLMDPEARTRFHEFMQERRTERRDDGVLLEEENEEESVETEIETEVEVETEADIEVDVETVIDAESGLDIDANGLLR